MTKQYKGRTATIEIDEKNVIIKSSFSLSLGFANSRKDDKAVVWAFHRRYVEKLPRLKRGWKAGMVLILIYLYR